MDCVSLLVTQLPPLASFSPHFPPSVSTPSTNHVTFIDEEGLHQTGLGIGAKGIEVNLTAKVQAIEYDKAIPQYPTNGNYNSRARLQYPTLDRGVPDG